jgi:hypothetical protein
VGSLWADLRRRQLSGHGDIVRFVLGSPSRPQVGETFTSGAQEIPGRRFKAGAGEGVDRACVARGEAVQQFHNSVQFSLTSILSS